MIKGRTSDSAEVGEKRKFEGHSKSNMYSRFSKSNPNNRKSRVTMRRNGVKKCKAKNVGQCVEVVTCYMCEKTSHYANKCTLKQKTFFGCGEARNFHRDCHQTKGVDISDEPEGSKR